ncbi:hypothetical protein ACG98H_03390 [Corynebacterium sp. L4756]|uniref:hypothetical protein n=1 Tax=unclassified Corynebacterium TaxID=2624378 RepID=UPI00374DB74D
MISSKTKAIIGIIVAGWLVVLMGLIAMNATRAEATVTGDLESSLEKMDEMELQGTSLAPMDIWGENTAAVMPICPGITEDEIAQMGVDTKQFTFENGAIPASTNYMLVLPMQGTPVVEKHFVENIDLCSQLSQMQPINPAALMVFLKDPAGAWLLVA